MRLSIILAAMAVVLAGMWTPPAMATQGFVTCESKGYRYQYCAVDTQGRAVLLREVSTGNLCRQGQGWGFDRGGIWVDKGCRGQFSYGRDDGGGDGWDRQGMVTCESMGYRYRFCNADTRGRVSLARELSTGNLCIRGSGWGYDDTGIWVNHGCRGQFRYGQDDRGRNDAAIAAGILGALAIGTAIGSSQSAPPPAPPPPPSPPKPSGGAPTWATGSFNAWDPDSGQTILLYVRTDGDVVLRNQSGAIVNNGSLRDGMVYWSNGKRSWLAREDPGVLLGDIDTGKHFFFRRGA